MSYLLCIFLITTFIIHPLNAMDLLQQGLTLGKSLTRKSSRPEENLPVAKQSENNLLENKKKRAKSSSLSTIEALPKKIVLPPLFELPEHQEHALITAARTNNLAIIDFYLNNQYINPNTIQSQLGNTALHYAAMHKHPEAVYHLLKDPRVDASKRNNNNKTARELVTGQTEANFSLRHKIFARISLNFNVDRQAKIIEISYLDGSITRELLKESIEAVKKSMSLDKERQVDDQALPSDAANMPPYATDEFILHMLLFRLANQK